METQERGRQVTLAEQTANRRAQDLCQLPHPTEFKLKVIILDRAIARDECQSGQGTGTALGLGVEAPEK